MPFGVAQAIQNVMEQGAFDNSGRFFRNIVMTETSLR